MWHTVAECAGPVHAALTHARRVSVSVVRQEADFVPEDAPPLFDGELARVFRCVSLLRGERNFADSSRPHVLGRSLHSGEIVRARYIHLLNQK